MHDMKTMRRMRLLKKKRHSAEQERQRLDAMSCSPISYDESDPDCQLCGNTGTVEIIPHGGGSNDAQEDECPWCLRKALLENAEAEGRPATTPPQT